jgi:hypothetical protein
MEFVAVAQIRRPERAEVAALAGFLSHSNGAENFAFLSEHSMGNQSKEV